jgi:hypothetical protein
MEVAVALCMASFTKRWSESKQCVKDPHRMMLTEAICAASGVWITKLGVLEIFTVLGADVIVGLAPANK